MIVTSNRPFQTSRQEKAQRDMQITVPPHYSGYSPKRVETVAQMKIASSNSRGDQRRPFEAQKNKKLSILGGHPTTLRKDLCDSAQSLHLSSQVETASSKVWSMPIIPPIDASGVPKKERNLTPLRDLPMLPMTSSYQSSRPQDPYPPRFGKNSCDSAKPLQKSNQAAIAPIPLPFDPPPLENHIPSLLPIISSYQSSGLQDRFPSRARRNSCGSFKPLQKSNQAAIALIPLPRDPQPMEVNLPLEVNPPPLPPMTYSSLSNGLQEPSPLRLPKSSCDLVNSSHKVRQATIASIAPPCDPQPMENHIPPLPPTTHSYQSSGLQDSSPLTLPKSSCDSSKSFRAASQTIPQVRAQESEKDIFDDEEALAMRVVSFVFSNEKPAQYRTSGKKELEEAPSKYIGGYKPKRALPPAPVPYLSSGVLAPPLLRREDSSDDEDARGIQTVWHIDSRSNETETTDSSLIFPNMNNPRPIE